MKDAAHLKTRTPGVYLAAQTFRVRLLPEEPSDFGTCGILIPQLERPRQTGHQRLEDIGPGVLTPGLAKRSKVVVAHRTFSLVWIEVMALYDAAQSSSVLIEMVVAIGVAWVKTSRGRTVTSGRSIPNLFSGGHHKVIFDVVVSRSSFERTKSRNWPFSLEGTKRKKGAHRR